jgi:lipopolysaccharide/colanic/teichoic acid biosynthesis glycosyltransferase
MELLPGDQPATPPKALAVGSERVRLMDELQRRFGGNRGLRNWHYLRKRWAWVLVTGGARVLKRVLDVYVALFALVTLAPLTLLVALAIWATDRGPVLFWQTRVGRWGREFRFPKFRSMVLDADRQKERLAALSHHQDQRTFKMRDDPRVTWIGRIIRKLSIDELPQVWNVLKGEMTLVGPRPPVPREVALYSLADRRRLDVTPGLTCLWQVSGRGDLPFERQLELDVQYIESRGFWLDMLILLKTVPAVLFGRGAY